MIEIKTEKELVKFLKKLLKNIPEVTGFNKKWHKHFIEFSTLKGFDKYELIFDKDYSSFYSCIKLNVNDENVCLLFPQWTAWQDYEEGIKSPLERILDKFIDMEVVEGDPEVISKPYISPSEIKIVDSNPLKDYYTLTNDTLLQYLDELSKSVYRGKKSAYSWGIL